MEKLATWLSVAIVAVGQVAVPLQGRLVGRSYSLPTIALNRGTPNRRSSLTCSSCSKSGASGVG